MFWGGAQRHQGELPPGSLSEKKGKDPSEKIGHVLEGGVKGLGRSGKEIKKNKYLLSPLCQAIHSMEAAPGDTQTGLCQVPCALFWI